MDLSRFVIKEAKVPASAKLLEAWGKAKARSMEVVYQGIKDLGDSNVGLSMEDPSDRAALAKFFHRFYQKNIRHQLHEILKKLAVPTTPAGAKEQGNLKTPPQLPQEERAWIIKTNIEDMRETHPGIREQLIRRLEIAEEKLAEKQQEEVLEEDGDDSEDGDYVPGGSLDSDSEEEDE